MAALTDADLRAVLSLVHEVSQATTATDFGETALREVHGLVSADISSLNEIDPAADRLVYVSEPGDVPLAPDATAVFHRLAWQHPLIGHFAQTGDGTAHRISDFWTADVWHDSELFRVFYAPLGVEHQMSITLPAPAPIVVAIEVNRVTAGSDFDERDRAVLNEIRPHLAQAWRRAREYERLTVLAGTASAALAAGGSLVVMLTDPPVELTPGALTALYRFFGRPGARDPLPSRVRRWPAEQTAAERAADDLHLARPLRATLGERRLVVRHLPAQPGHSAALLLDELSAAGPGLDMRSVGLTPREVDVLTLVAQGASNADIATGLSLSPWTVKRHIANGYAKLGVRNRAAATAVMIEMAGHHHLESHLDS